MKAKDLADRLSSEWETVGKKKPWRLFFADSVKPLVREIVDYCQDLVKKRSASRPVAVVSCFEQGAILWKSVLARLPDLPLRQDIFWMVAYDTVEGLRMLQQGAAPETRKRPSAAHGRRRRRRSKKASSGATSAAVS